MRRIANPLFAVIVVAACGSGSQTGPQSPASTTASPSVSLAAPASPSSTAVPPSPTAVPTSPTAALVGKWQQIRSCEAYVGALKQHGLLDLAARNISGEYRTESPAVIAKDSNLCRGAIRVQHSHQFTANGRFASFDQTGAQVDDSTYMIVDDHTFRMGAGDPRSAFAVGYRVAGDAIAFQVLAPSSCTGACRDNLAFALATFLPGAWMRAP